MSFTDNFGHPKGLLGRMMLISMDKEHLPMAEWAFTRFEIPKEGKIVDIGCGGGYNIKRMLSKSPRGKIYGFDISEESVKKARKVNKDQIGKRVEIHGDPSIDWEKKVPCMTRYTAEKINEFMEKAGFEDIKIAKKDNMFCIEGTKK